MKYVKALGEGLGKTLLVSGFTLGLVSMASAFSMSESNFLKEVKEIVVDKMLNGPIGRAAGVGLIVYGMAQLFMSRITGAVLSIVSGAVIANADGIANTLGMTINNF